MQAGRILSCIKEDRGLVRPLSESPLASTAGRFEHTITDAGTTIITVSQDRYPVKSCLAFFLGCKQHRRYTTR